MTNQLVNVYFSVDIFGGTYIHLFRLFKCSVSVQFYQTAKDILFKIKEIGKEIILQ